MSMEVIGTEVKKIRTELGISQEHLAIDAGISRGHLASIETGRRGATSPVIRKVARALGLKSPDRITA